MPRISKYNNVMASRIIELASLGYNKTEICKLIVVARSTLDMWIRKDKSLLNRMEKAEADFMQGAIKRGLVALSEGAKTTESVREYAEEDETGRIVKTTEKVRTLAPSEKAIQILSKKYAKEFAAETDALQGDKQLTLDINVNALSRRELLELRAKDNPLDYVEAEAVEVVEDSELLPPTKDS